MDDHSEAEEEPHRGRFLTGARPMSSLHRRDPSEEAEADVMPFPEGTAAKPIHIITNPRPFSNSSTGYPSRSEAQSPLPPPPSTSDSSAKEETDPLAGRGHQLPVPALLRVVAVTDNSPHRHRSSRTTSIGHELTSHSFPPNELRGSARSSQSRQHATITGPAPEPWLVPTTHLTSAAVAFTSTELKLPATILPPMLNRKGGRCDVIDGSSSRGRDFDASPKQRRSRSLRSGECRSDCVSGDDRLSRAHSEAVRVEHVAIIGHSPSHLPNAGALRGQSRSPGREGQEHQEQLIRADRQNSTGSNSRDAPQILPPCQPGHSARVHGEASLCLYSPSRADSPVGLPRTLVQEDSSFFYEASQPLASQRQHSCSASASSRPTQPVLTQTNSGTSEDGAGAGRERASRSIPNSNASGTDNSLRAARAVLKKHYSRAYNTPSGGGGASSSKSERQSKSRKKASEGDSAVSTRDGASGSSQRTPRAGEPVVAFMDQTDRAPSPHHDSQEMTSCSKSSGLSHVHARGTKSSNPTGTSTTSRTNGAEESEGVSVVEKDSPGSGKTESGAAPDSAHPLVEMLELLSPSESQHMMPEVSGTSAPKVSPRAWGGTNRDGIPAPVSTPSHTKNPSMMECSSSEEELYHRSIVDRLALQLTHNSRLFGSSVAQYSTVDADAVFHGVAHNNGGTNSAAGGGGGFVAISPTTTFGGEENIFSAACSMTGWSALGEGCSTDWYAMMRRKNENEGEVNEEAQAEADGTHPPSDPATASTESDAAHPSGHTGLPRLCSARASNVVVALPSVFSQVPSMVVDLPPCLDNDLMQDTLDLMSASVNSSERHQQGGLEPVRRCSTVGPNHDDENDSVVDIFESPERRTHTRASRDGATSRLSVSATTDDIPPITRRDSEVREGGRPHTMHHGTSSGRLNSLARGGRIPSPSRRHSNSSTAIERAPLFEPEPPQSGRGPSSPRIAHSTFRDSPPSHSSILEGAEGGRPEHSVSEATAVARDVLPAALGVEAENNNLASTSSSQKSDVPSPGASRRQPRSKRANRQRMESPNPVPLPSTSPAVAVG